MKAIETVYHGCRFRSRLEARWAVFFDSLEIGWQYEPEGFVVGMYGGQRYLPDFFLPKTQTWVEVKGAADLFDFNLLADAVDWGHGLPGTVESFGTSRGLLLLGPIPWPAGKSPLHPILQHGKGGFVNLSYFWTRGTIEIAESDTFPPYFDSSCRDGIGREGRGLVEACWRDECQGLPLPPDVGIAYRAARMARFEHGETPIVVSRPLGTDPATVFRTVLEIRHPQLSVALEEAAIRLDGRQIQIIINNPVLERRMAEPRFRGILEDAARAIHGERVRVVVLQSGAA